MPRMKHCAQNMTGIVLFGFQEGGRFSLKFVHAILFEKLIFVNHVVPKPEDSDMNIALSCGLDYIVLYNDQRAYYVVAKTTTTTAALLWIGWPLFCSHVIVARIDCDTCHSSCSNRNHSDAILTFFMHNIIYIAIKYNKNEMKRKSVDQLVSQCTVKNK